ncbi:MAG TPA: phage tail sheath subtilisin-like domain-containing protein [Blastocatellia bacterium]|nr:phage tail sheath subtilisin-like domain-containing protein [Blastocatellia bacterium]
MPVTPTYPGVYIEEVPSGVRTITGVATSITAFVGRAVRGPAGEPVTVNGFGDYERIFGGLSLDSTMSYAVRDFFLNGGGQAIVVRLFRPFYASAGDHASAVTAATAAATAAAQAVANGATGADAEAAAAGAEAVAAAPPIPAGATPETVAAVHSAANAVAAAARNSLPAAANAAAVKAAAVAATAGAVSSAVAASVPLTRAQLTLGTTNALHLEAASEGGWGNKLRARVNYGTRDPGENTLFNISVKDGSTGKIENHLNVSVQAGHPRQVDRVLAQESTLVRATGALPALRPEASAPAATATVPAGVVAPGQDPFTAALSTGVTTVASDGRALTANDYLGTTADKHGLFALEKADLFNLLCIPPDVRNGDTAPSVYQAAVRYCVERRAMLIVDSPAGWSTPKETAAAKARDAVMANDLGLALVESRNAALYFPRVVQVDPLRDGQLDTFVPCGIVAGVMARTDAQRGVWKAPAGLDATLNGVQGLEVNLTDSENGMLNPIAVNCLRSFPVAGRVVWGARTLRGADQLADEYKYVPVRRLVLFLEESLYRGTQWVVFEPNDEPLWAQIRLNVGAFMQNLFRQGAFQGTTPRDAYFVQCDRTTTTQNEINLGIVNIVVGFAPLKPAEFVIIHIQQMAGQIAT